MSSATRAAGALVLASLVATAAAAQGARTQFGAGASLTFPIGDFHADANGDGFKMGWQGIALLEVQPRGSPVGFRVDGTYGENNSNDKFNADLSAFVGAPRTAKVKQLGGTANVVYHFKRSWRGSVLRSALCGRCEVVRHGEDDVHPLHGGRPFRRQIDPPDV